MKQKVKQKKKGERCKKAEGEEQSRAEVSALQQSSIAAVAEHMPGKGPTLILT